MRIRYEGLAVPVTQRLANRLQQHLYEKNITSGDVILNYRDPSYSPDQGGFHPVEIRLVEKSGSWHFDYITDFAFVGSGYEAELAKELDFDFSSGTFQTLFGVFPIEQGRELYEIWEDNFLHYWLRQAIFQIAFSYRDYSPFSGGLD